MIPVKGYLGQEVGVLGLGRTGLTAARALVSGGALPVLWDDGAEARARAEAEGFVLRDLTRAGAVEGLAAVITSPGIAHLYPAPHPVLGRGLCRRRASGQRYRAFLSLLWRRAIGTGSMSCPRLWP